MSESLAAESEYLLLIMSGRITRSSTRSSGASNSHLPYPPRGRGRGRGGRSRGRGGRGGTRITDITAADTASDQVARSDPALNSEVQDVLAAFTVDQLLSLIRTEVANASRQQPQDQASAGQG